MDDIELGVCRQGQLDRVDERDLARRREIRRMQDAKDGLRAGPMNGGHDRYSWTDIIVPNPSIPSPRDLVT
jgi:hypothetical protein